MASPAESALFSNATAATPQSGGVTASDLFGGGSNSGSQENSGTNNSSINENDLFGSNNQEKGTAEIPAGFDINAPAKIPQSVIDQNAKISAPTAQPSFFSKAMDFVKSGVIQNAAKNSGNTASIKSLIPPPQSIPGTEQQMARDSVVQSTTDYLNNQTYLNVGKQLGIDKMVKSNVPSGADPVTTQWYKDQATAVAVKNNWDVLSKTYPELKNFQPVQSEQVDKNLDAVLQQEGLFNGITPDQHIKDISTILQVAGGIGLAFTGVGIAADIAEGSAILGGSAALGEAGSDVAGISSIYGLSLAYNGVNALVSAGATGLTFYALDKVTQPILKNILANPNLSEQGRAYVQLGALAADFLATEGLMKGAPKFLDFLAHDTVESAQLPKTMIFDGSYVKKALENGTITQDQVDQMAKEYGWTDEEKQNITKTGIKVSVPSTKVITTADRPWWKSVQKSFGFDEAPNRVQNTFIGGKVEFTPGEDSDAQSKIENAVKQTTERPEGDIGIPSDVQAKIDAAGKEFGVKPQTEREPAEKGSTVGEGKITIIRHGSTDLNDEGKMRGWNQMSLDEKGREQAIDIGKSLDGKPLDGIVTSDLNRAKQTAQSISKQINVPILDENKGLRTWDVGKLTGTDAVEATKTLNKYATQMPSVPVPGGESFDTFKNRFLSTIQDIQEKHSDQRIAVVTHHMGERILASWIKNGSPSDFSLNMKEFTDKEGLAPGSQMDMQISPKEKEIKPKFKEKRITENDESFMKGEKVYSGSDKEIKIWNQPYSSDSGTVFAGLNVWGDGIYVTDSPEYAKTFGKKVTESIIKPNLKFFDVRDTASLNTEEKNSIIKSFQKIYAKTISSGFTKDITEALEGAEDPIELFDTLQNEVGTYTTDVLKKAGFDGIIADESKMNGGNIVGGKVYNIFDTKNIKTKSQISKTGSAISFKQGDEIPDGTTEGKYAVDRVQTYLDRLGIKGVDVSLLHAIEVGINEKTGKMGWAYGAYGNNKIAIADRVAKFTGDHEVVHLVFDNLRNIPTFVGITRGDLLAELRAKYPELTKNNFRANKDLEEKLAEDFEDFVRDQENKSWSKRIKKFFQKLYAAIKNLLGIPEEALSAIADFYDRLYNAKAKAETNLESKGSFADQVDDENILRANSPSVKLFQTAAEEDDWGSPIPEDERNTSQATEDMNVVDQIIEKYGSLPETLDEANKLTPEELSNVMHLIPLDLAYQIAGIGENDRDYLTPQQQVADDVLDGKMKIKVSPGNYQAEARGALGRGLYNFIFRKNYGSAIDEFASDHGFEDEAHVVNTILGRYEDRLAIKDQAKAEAARIKLQNKSETDARLAMQKKIRELMSSIPTQKTTEGAKTKKVINETNRTAYAVQTVREIDFIRARLKMFGQGFKEGEKSGFEEGKQEAATVADQKLEGKVVQSEQNALKTTMRALSRGSKIGFRGAKVETKEIQSALVDMMKQLPISERGKADMLATIKNANTPDKMETATEKIEEKINAYNEARAMAKDLGLARSKLSFLKKLGDFDGTTVEDAKKQLGLSGPIKDLKQEEIDALTDEMVKRLQFKRGLGYGLEGKPLTDSEYEDIAKDLSKNGLAKEEKPGIIKQTRDAIDYALGVSSTRLYEINPDLSRAVRDYNFEYHKLETVWGKAIEPFTKFLNDIEKKAPEDYFQLHLALANRDPEKVNQILEKYPDAEIAPIRALLDEIESKVRASGIEMGHLDNYFPRQAINPSTLLDTKIRQAQLKLGRDLTNDEKDAVANNIMLGFDRNKYLLTKSGFMKEREIDFLDKETAGLYKKPQEALSSYVSTMARQVSARNFFGKHAETMAPNDSYDESIGTYVMEMVDKGELTPEISKEVQGIIRGIFSNNNMSPLMKNISNISYATAMGQITSALSILQHFTFSLLENGLLGTIKATGEVLKKQGITRTELYLPHDIQELVDKNKLAQAVRKIFDATGISFADNLTLQAFITGRFNAYKKAALLGKLPQNFVQKLTDVFGKDYNQVIEDLKAGQLTDSVKRLIFDDVLDVRPEGATEKPEGYNMAGNLKAAYQMKMFALKQLDTFRKLGFSQIEAGIKNGERWRIKEGLFTIAKLLAILIIVKLTKDEIEAVIEGKKLAISSESGNILLGIAGLSTYNIDTFARDGFAKGIAGILTPISLSEPAQIASDAYNDIKQAVQGNLTPHTSKLTADLPFIGHILYNRLNKGTTGVVQATILKSAKAANTKLAKLDPVDVSAAKIAWDQVKKAGVGTDEAATIVSNLSDAQYKTYNLVKTTDSSYWNKLSNTVSPLVAKANSAGFGTPEADSIVSSLSDDEYKMYKDIKTATYGKTVPGASSDTAGNASFPDTGAGKDAKGFVSEVVTYARAIGSDPLTALGDIFKGQKIARLQNGTIIVFRDNKAESSGKQKLFNQAKKEGKIVQSGNISDYTLDHVRSLELGGDNTTGNFQILPKAQAAEDDAVENYLAKALNTGKITGDQAKQYELEYKKGADEPVTMNPEVFKNVDKTLTFDQIKQEIGI